MSGEQGDVGQPPFVMKCRCNPLNPHQEDCPLNPSFAPVAEQGDVRPEGREGMVTVYDSADRYLGCMGREAWERLLASVTEQGNVQSWREAEVLIRESLLDGTVGGDLSEVRYNRAIMALTALTAQIEESERERQNAEDRTKAATLFEKWKARAEKAELALAEAERALRDIDGLARSGYGRDTIGGIARIALRPSEDTSDES